MKRILRNVTGLSLSLLVALPMWASGQGRVEHALDFLAGGGSYCFRVVPFGVALSKETQWTVMVLTSKSNRKTTFRMRDVDPGNTHLSGAALATASMAVTEVWGFEGYREEFFKKFAEGIRTGVLRARVLKVTPPSLAQLESDSERAELYLKFAERGPSISFENAPDLTAEEFEQYSSHFPD